MNAVARLFCKQWLWFVAVIGLGLAGCTVFATSAVITIAFRKTGIASVLCLQMKKCYV